MYDFEAIYETIIGQRIPEAAVPDVEDISMDGTSYSAAREALMKARDSLVTRFSMNPEDRDLECILNAVSVMEREAALAVYQAIRREI